jgi:hypothetical protein
LITFLRVPIFLGPVNEHELREAADTRAQLGLFEKDLHEELGDQVDDEENYNIESQAQSPKRVELERMDSDMIMFEEEKETIDATNFKPSQAVMSHSSSSRAPAVSEAAAIGAGDKKQKFPYFEMDTDMISFEDRDPITNSPYRKTTTPTDGSPAKYDTAALSSRNLIEFEDIPHYDRLRGDSSHSPEILRLPPAVSDCDSFRPSVTAAVPAPVVADRPVAVDVTSTQAMPVHPESMTHNNTVPPALPIRSSAPTPFNGITRGIVTPKEVGATDRLDVLNGDIQQILSSMKGDGSTRPPEKPARGPPKKPEKGPPMMRPEKALLMAAEKVQQIRSERNSPVRAVESSPIKVRKTSPIRAAESSPIKVRKTSPIRTEKTSPIRSEMTSPVRSEKTSPIKVRVASPIRVEVSSERKLMMGIIVISPPRSRNQSPARPHGTRTQIPVSPVAEPVSEIRAEKGFKEEKEVEVVEVKVEEKEVEVEVVMEKEVEEVVEVDENEVVSAEVKSCLSDDIPLPPVLPPLSPSHSSSSSSAPSCAEKLPTDHSNQEILDKENNRETKSRNNIPPFGTKTLRSDSCDSTGSDHYDRHGDVTEKPKPPRRGTGYAPPSSDPTVEVRYFGHQRVVIKRK